MLHIHPSFLYEVEARRIGSLGSPIPWDDVLSGEGLLGSQGCQPNRKWSNEWAWREAPGGTPDVLHVLPLCRLCLHA